jgi:hypothetical protein
VTSLNAGLGLPKQRFLHRLQVVDRDEHRGGPTVSPAKEQAVITT